MYKISVLIGVIIYRCCGHDRNCIDTIEEGEVVGGGGSENVAVKAAESDKLQRGLRRNRHPESRNVQNYRSKSQISAMWPLAGWIFFHPSDGPSSKRKVRGSGSGVTGACDSRVAGMEARTMG